MMQKKNGTKPKNRHKTGLYVTIMLSGSIVMFSAGVVFTILELRGYL